MTKAIHAFVFLEELFILMFQRNRRNFSKVHSFSQSYYTEVLPGHPQSLNCDGWKDFSVVWRNGLKAQIATTRHSNNLNYSLYAFN